jgi:hypothetical protein
MARYNSSSGNATINQAATITSPYSGAFTEFTGTAPYTVALPSPIPFPGSSQTFYNATAGKITLTTPSGIFSGLGASGTSSLDMLTNTVVSVTSDGTNYVVLSEDGSALVATTGTFSGNVDMSGASATVTISPQTLTMSPTSSGSLNNTNIGVTTRGSGAFNTLAANSAVTFTANTASSSTTTGTLVVTGGIGASGTVYAGGFNGNLTGTLQTASQPNITSATGLTSVGTLTALTVNGTNSVYNNTSGAGAQAVAYSEVVQKAVNLAAGASVDVSTISVTNDAHWRAIVRGTYTNNYEGGGLTPPALFIELNSTQNTIPCGSTSITVSRNAATNKLQFTNTNSSYIVLFTGTIEIIVTSQSGQAGRSITTVGAVGIGTNAPGAQLHVLNSGGSTSAPNLALILDYESATTALSGAGTAIELRGKSSGGNIANYQHARIRSTSQDTNNAHGIAFDVKPNAGTNLTEALSIDGGSNVYVPTKLWVATATDGNIGDASSNVKLVINGDQHFTRQSAKIYFGDVTNAVPLSIGEGEQGTSGTDTDRMGIYSRNRLTVFGYKYGDSSQSAEWSRQTASALALTTELYSTYTRSYATPDGGTQTVRFCEDCLGRWIVVGKFAASAKDSIGNTWSSVRGLSTSTSQSDTTAFSADFGSSYPTEVRVMGSTNFDYWKENRTIDFVYRVPSGRTWATFFNSGSTNGDSMMTVTARYGFKVNGGYDGFGRWNNSSLTDIGMSDGVYTNPSTAYSTPTASAFNWYTTQDGKLSIIHTGAYSGQDVNTTSSVGYDDAVAGFFDVFPSTSSNHAAGAVFSSAVWVMIKLN